MRKTNDLREGKRAFMVMLALLLFSPLSRASAEQVYYVPDSSRLIQQAIDQAEEGSTIIVGPGIYNESIRINKMLTLRSEQGPAVTTIRGGGYRFDLLAPVVELCCPGGAVLDGFSITMDSFSGDAMCSEMGGSDDPVQGAGIYCRDIGVSTITNCVIEHNAGNFSGGIFCDSASPTITNCIIRNNAGEFGGAICCRNASPTITNCIISHNNGCWGGGIACLNASSPTLTNCTVSGNSALSLPGGGGIGLPPECYSSLSMVNCIVWGNTNPYGEPIQICKHDDTSSIDITYSDIQPTHIRDYKIATQGVGNICVDPEFVDDDCHLDRSSRCIDAGSNDVPGLPDIDFEGDPRIVNGNSDGIAVVDMGAHEAGEYDPDLLVADFEIDRPAGTVKTDPFVQTRVLEPLTVQFTDSSTGMVTSRLWDFGDGGTSTEENPSHGYYAKGDYAVSLTVAGPDGSDSRTVQYCIHVTDLPRVIQVFPSTIRPGQVLTIVGYDFDDAEHSKGELEYRPGDPSMCDVTIGDVTCRLGDADIVSWSDCMIRVRVPSYDFGSSSWIRTDVSVTVNQYYTSNKRPITILRP